MPAGLSPGQAAQLSEIFEYLHLQSRTLVQSATLPEGQSHVKIDLVQWQQLLDLQAQLAEYLRKIGGRKRSEPLKTSTLICAMIERSVLLIKAPISEH